MAFTYILIGSRIEVSRGLKGTAIFMAFYDLHGCSSFSLDKKTSRLKEAGSF